MIAPLRALAPSALRSIAHRIVRLAIVATFLVSVGVCAWTALWSGAVSAALISVIGCILLLAELHKHRTLHSPDVSDAPAAPAPRALAAARVPPPPQTHSTDVPMWARQVAVLPAPVDVVCFQLADTMTERLIHTYTRESAALAFVRDIVRLRSRQDAAHFRLRAVPRGALPETVAEGEQLVQRALEDRVL